MYLFIFVVATCAFGLLFFSFTFYIQYYFLLVSGVNVQAHTVTTDAY